VFMEMIIAIRDSSTHLAMFDDEVDGDHETDEDSVLRKLSEDDEPGWVVGKIYKTIQLYMERFRQKQMKLEELTQRGWGGAPNHSCEINKM